MMWWAMWCAAVVVASGVVAAPSADSMSPLEIQQIDSPASDEDGYAGAQMGGRYASAPWLYFLSEAPRDTQSTAEFGEGLSRPKRKMPSLSINNPMEVLRQRLILEVARKQMREANQRQAFANRLFLQNVGKRGFWTHTGPRYDN